MNVMCVDDERIILADIVSTCRKIELVDNVEGFSWCDEAIEYVKRNHVDIAFLDINMPDMTGIDLAERILSISPRTYVVFTTGYDNYAIDAFKVRAFGYLLKPIREEDLRREIEYIDYKMKSQNVQRDISVITFGNFEVYVKNKPVHFHRNKSKEILAYLIDRQGTGVSRKELAAVLWEDGMYDRNRQYQINTFIRSLKIDLAEAGAEEMLIQANGALMVDVNTFVCDMYDFMKGDVRAINSYRGTYMYSYSWAEFTSAKMSNYIENNVT